MHSSSKDNQPINPGHLHLTECVHHRNGSYKRSIRYYDPTNSTECYRKAPATPLEFTCVILVECFPTFPQFLKYCRDKGNRRSSNRAYAKWHSAPGSDDDRRSFSKTGMQFSRNTQPTLSNRTAIDCETARNCIHSRERPNSIPSTISYASTNVPASPQVEAPVSPVSPNAARPMSSDLLQARQISVTPIHLATIRKTVDVRVSNHTNCPSLFDQETAKKR
ncbi:hypothetical protein BCR34DRAFT_649136 [Clohesyomyces aquaticus]|uniref:Uncharacterized protein n=1 Tax=Clohesyomyces aquaticus TaxID=1231657 RepID=A0A1Y1ZTN5_9PLEO|nr:hypothetical protein BCR34DRAFT_649136 [Clohesyomyces aquaticus]